MKKLPDFLLCNNQALQIAGLVLYTKPPFYIGKTVHFENQLLYEEFVTKCTDSDNSIPFVKIEGYRVAMLQAGQLINNDPKNIDELKLILKLMGEFFLQEKIIGHPFKYKRYKETDTDQ